MFETRFYDMKHSNNLFLRLAALSLVLLLLLPTLLSCASNEAPTEMGATEVIGSAGGVEITYDELYFLIKTYEDTLTEQYKNDPEGLRTALDELVKAELIANAAIRLLCEEHGLKYKESKLSDEVDDKLEAILQSDFGGDEEAYRASMAEAGITDHYLRYTTGLDILYAELTSVYPEKGLVATSTPALRAHILDNFICTYHIALFNDTPEEDISNYARMLEAKAMLEAGTATMYDLIKGSKKVAGEPVSLAAYNEDVSDISGSGHYLTRGTWDKAYEDAAFALKMGEISDVVLATGESPKTGKTVPTYYLIQRERLDEDYIDKNLSALQDEYYASEIYSDLEEKRESLTFEPNELYESLDLANLLPVVEKDNSLLVIVLCSLGGIAILGGGVAVFVIVRRRKKNA